MWSDFLIHLAQALLEPDPGEHRDEADRLLMPPKIRQVRSTDYVSTKKDGTERLNFTAFYEALLEAKGVSLGDAGSSGGKGKPGRSLSYASKIQFNGNLLVGKAYTAQLGLKPGD